MRYKFYVADNKVICVSSYAGRPVRGIAKCDTDHDTFNVETGKKLAQLRCDYKIAEKRVQRASQKHFEACVDYENANIRKIQMEKYLEDSFDELADISKQLEAFEKSL